MTESNRLVLYTIGHSNYDLERFIDLLKMHQITAVADVRSSPFSQYCPHFNRESLSNSLESAGIRYVYLGKELGARQDDLPYCPSGHVSFENMAERPEFKRGLDRLYEGMEKFRIAIMCSEKEPLVCHRTILVCRNLKRYGISIKHILEDGGVEDHQDAERRLVKMMKIEPNLFEQEITEADRIKRAYDQQADKIVYQGDSELELQTQ